jgi:hypothetical protein
MNDDSRRSARTNLLDVKMNRRRGLIGAASIMLGANACGYILYPERRGRTGGRIDVGVLIIDLLWLLPGLIPGAICLAVDFTTGCIYEGGASAANDPAEDPALTTASVELDGREVAKGELDTDRRAQLTWAYGADELSVRARGRLVFRRADGRVATALVGDLI